MLANLLKVITKGLSNPKVQKILLVILLILVAMYLLNKGSGKFKQFFQSTFRGIQGDNVNAPITDARKQWLEDLAQALYSEIYDWFGSNETIESILIQMNSLPDSELAYIATYYNGFLSTNTLYYDIDWEFMPFEDVDDDIMARLSAMNLN